MKASSASIVSAVISSCALRPGIDVAMQAALVAAIAEIDLYGFHRPSGQGRKVSGHEKGQGDVHVGRFSSGIVVGLLALVVRERMFLTALDRCAGPTLVRRGLSRR
jgi:hypothetical protein